MYHDKLPGTLHDITGDLRPVGYRRIATEEAFCPPQMLDIYRDMLDVFVYATPYFPTNLPPGDAPFYAAASIAYSIVWMAYLIWSKRVRESVTSSSTGPSNCTTSCSGVRITSHARRGERRQRSPRR